MAYSIEVELEIGTVTRVSPVVHSQDLDGPAIIEAPPGVSAPRLSM